MRIGKKNVVKACYKTWVHVHLAKAVVVTQRERRFHRVLHSVVWTLPGIAPNVRKARDATLNNQVTIAKMDIEANDFPDQDIPGFPTFKLFPAGSKESPILYAGPDILEDVTNFIIDNGKHKAEVGLKSRGMNNEISNELPKMSLSGCVKVSAHVGRRVLRIALLIALGVLMFPHRGRRIAALSV
jgi:hypothetical protein